MAVSGVVLLLGLTTVISMSPAPRTVLSPTVLDPSAIPGAADLPPTAEPSASTDDGPALYDAGEQIPLTLDGQAIGTIKAMPSLSEPDPPATTVHLTLAVTYAATGAMPFDAGTWDALLADGTTVTLEPIAGPNAVKRALKAGETATIVFEADLDARPTDAFAVYTDVASSTMVFGVPIP